MTVRGIVKMWNEARGFGFIIPEDNGRDVFVHRTQIMTPDPRMLIEGQEVEFVIGTGLDGRPRAEQVIPQVSSDPYRDEG